MPCVRAANIQIHWSNTRAFYDSSSSFPGLSAGTFADGDGTLLQLGYYTTATHSTPFPFMGTWVTLATASIGDSGVDLPGRFDVLSILTGGTFPEPEAGTPLAVRFFDGVSKELSGYFNVATNLDGYWDWISPTDDTLTITVEVSKEVARFEGYAFETSIENTMIPEPSVIGLLLAGAGCLAIRRLRKENSAVRERQSAETGSFSRLSWIFPSSRHAES